MYLLFKSVESRQLGIVQVIGRWMEFSFGYVPDTHVDIAEYRHLNPRIIDEAVAWAWMYIGRYNGHISVRTGTPQNERLQILTSHEATGEKARYDLTDDDHKNTALLMKEVFRFKLDEIFDKRMLQLSMNVSSLEQKSWPQQQAEAERYNAGDTASQPLLTALASARGITLEEMVAKVTAGVADHDAKVVDLLARKHALETELKECTTIADCNRFMHNRFELEMSGQQREDEGIDYSAVFNV
jgi:hypothetical protein